MKRSQTYDPSLHREGGAAAAGGCTFHAADDPGCAREAVVSYEEGGGEWSAGCRTALEELVERGEIEPLGQGA